MVLEIPGGLFGQSDVRETATAETGTSYVSIPGVAFDTDDNAKDFQKSNTGGTIRTDESMNLVAPIQIPNGAIITAAITYGNAGAEGEIWTLYRIAVSGAATSALAGTAVNTEDTSISTPIIDNSLYAYYIGIPSLDAADEIYGARITYTL